MGCMGLMDVAGRRVGMGMGCSVSLFSVFFLIPEVVVFMIL